MNRSRLFAWQAVVLLPALVAPPVRGEQLPRTEVARRGKAATALVQLNPLTVHGTAVGVHPAGYFVTSDRHVAALRRHRAARIEAAPQRRPFPRDWKLDLQTLMRGRLVYLRRTNALGEVAVLGRSFEVDRQWTNRLVRIVVDLKAGRLRVYRLRRREPSDQPLLREIRHRVPDRGLRE